MKLYKIFTLLFFFSFYLGKAQMPGMGGSGGNSMNGMNNVPQGTNNSGTSKKAEPPHGGDIKEAGKYFIEIVFDAFATDEKLSIWLLKGSYKPANLEKVTGKIKIKYPKNNAKEEEYDLTIVDGKFICNTVDASQAFTAFITITVKDKEYRAVYNHKAM